MHVTVVTTELSTQPPVVLVQATTLFLLCKRNSSQYSMHSNTSATAMEQRSRYTIAFSTNTEVRPNGTVLASNKIIV